MRALMLDTQGGGVGYYRFKVPHAVLSKFMEVDYLCIGDVKSKDIPQWLFQEFSKYDLVHIGYITHLPYIEACVAAREKYGMPFVADIDDDILNVPTYNAAFKAYHGGAAERKLARLFLRISDAVTVSTPQLADALRAECNDIAVLPNTLNADDWVMREQLPRDRSVRAMFAGNIGRYGDLLEVGEAFEYAMEKHEELRLLFMTCVPEWAGKWMGDMKDQSANRAYVIRRCAVETYRAVFMWANADIVFAPIQGNVFNKSKSHIKAYDAAMCGAAFLCSDWDTYAEVPNNAAIKVSGTYEWKEALDHLIGDKEMRERLAGRLKEWAVSEWKIGKHIHKWVELYERVIAKGPISDISQIVRPGGQSDVGGGDGLDRQHAGAECEVNLAGQGAADVRG